MFCAVSWEAIEGRQGRERHHQTVLSDGEWRPEEPVRSRRDSFPENSAGSQAGVRAAEEGQAEPLLMLVGEEEDPQGFSEPQLPTWAEGLPLPNLQFLRAGSTPSGGKSHV